MKLEEKRWRKNSEIGIKSKSNKNENKYENENNISGKDSKWYTEIEIEENEQNKILQFDWLVPRKQLISSALVVFLIDIILYTVSQFPRLFVCLSTCLVPSLSLFSACLSLSVSLFVYHSISLSLSLSLTLSLYQSYPKLRIILTYAHSYGSNDIVTHNIHVADIFPPGILVSY